MRAMIGVVRRLAIGALLATTSSLVAGCASQPPLGYYGSVYEEQAVPGGPRTPLQIYRRLIEDGYEFFSPPQQQGAVYFVGVFNQRHEANCLVVEAFTGAILQSYQYRGEWIEARNRNTPGPGFPGDPPFVDGHHLAPMCPAPPGRPPKIPVNGVVEFFPADTPAQALEPQAETSTLLPSFVRALF
jgi:hypothetical protein